MYPEAFINWIGDNSYFRSKGIWYVWKKDEQMETPIAETTEEPYKEFLEWQKKTMDKSIV